MMYMVVLIFSIDGAVPCSIFLTFCAHSCIETVITLLRTLLYICCNGILRGIYIWYTNFINCKKNILYHSDKLLHLVLPLRFAVHIKQYFCVVDKQQDILLKIIWIFVIIGSLILL
jgi:hypothetical protein